MDEEDDDIYEPSGAADEAALHNGNRVKQDEDREDEDDGEEAGDGSDSDVDFIIEEKPNGTKQESITQPLKRERAGSSRPPESNNDRKVPRLSASPRPSSTRPTTRRSAPSSTKPGTDYPAVHDTTVDPEAALPCYTLKDGSTKPLIDLDFDADLAEHTKPWRLPGSDMTDYFNYGFDEFSWATYCLKQQQMRGTIKQDEAQRIEMQSALAGMPGGPQGGMPPMPMPGMPGMPGMPEMNPEMMNAMMQQMQAGGMDPSQMDFSAFMQNAHGMQNGPGMHNQGPPQGAPLGPGMHGQQGGHQNYGGGGGRRRGRW